MKKWPAPGFVLNAFLYKPAMTTTLGTEMTKEFGRIMIYSTCGALLLAAVGGLLFTEALAGVTIGCSMGFLIGVIYAALTND